MVFYFIAIRIFLFTSKKWSRVDTTLNSIELKDWHFQIGSGFGNFYFCKIVILTTIYIELLTGCLRLYHCFQEWSSDAH